MRGGSLHTPTPVPTPTHPTDVCVLRRPGAPVCVILGMCCTRVCRVYHVCAVCDHVRAVCVPCVLCVAMYDHVCAVRSVCGHV